MKLDDATVVWSGSRSRYIVFKYGINYNMTNEVGEWLRENFDGGYGVGYYYVHSRIYFREEEDVTVFKLRFGL